MSISSLRGRRALQGRGDHQNVNRPSAFGRGCAHHTGQGPSWAIPPQSRAGAPGLDACGSACPSLTSTLNRQGRRQLPCPFRQRRNLNPRDACHPYKDCLNRDEKADSFSTAPTSLGLLRSVPPEYLRPVRADEPCS